MPGRKHVAKSVVKVSGFNSGVWKISVQNSRIIKTKSFIAAQSEI
jgi:hypothetical protein